MVVVMMSIMEEVIRMMVVVIVVMVVDYLGNANSASSGTIAIAGTAGA